MSEREPWPIGTRLRKLRGATDDTLCHVRGHVDGREVVRWWSRRWRWWIYEVVEAAEIEAGLWREDDA